MRNLLFTLFTFMTAITFAQSKGTVSGIVQDKDMGLEPLPFVSIYDEKDSSVGTTTDFDGLYTIKLSAGVHTLVFDFVGYETIKKQVTVKAGATQKINIVMASAADALDAVILTAVVSKESEEALLAVQKEKVEIVESIGAEQLSKAGVSNAAAATTKIAGVTKSESSGSVFIRGLGDRYLLTTMNGLPIPSDDIEKKNVNLNLFSTGVIQNVSISKTYAASSYGDQTSGRVDVSSKEYSKSNDNIKIGIGTGANTNVLGVFGNFRASQNVEKTSALGFYSSGQTVKESVTTQSWNPATISTPVNYSFSVVGGRKLDVGDTGKLSFVASLANSKSFSYLDGSFQNYRGNELTDSYSDAVKYSSTSNTTALLDVKFDFNPSHNIRLVNLLINKTQDNLYELGRNGTGLTIDNSPEALAGSFVRDQNIKVTQILINQLLGSHAISDVNTLKWALGVNNVLASEPNRIRNEFVIGDGTVLTDFTPVGDVIPSINNKFQQRKSTQKINDFEFNGFLNDKHDFINEDEKQFSITGGVDFRIRNRDFESQFVGVDASGLVFNSVDDLSDVFKSSFFISNAIETETLQPDIYAAKLIYVGAYLSSVFKFNNTTFDVGVRFEDNDIQITSWDVNNYTNPITGVPREGALSSPYSNILPHFNFKQQINDEHSLRISASKTITLPEFKELAPFEYTSNTGRVTKGNPNLIASTNFNFDVKWEMYPSDSELISLTAFYKNIKDPINYTIERGAAGNFTYDNTGEQANIYGLELESKFNLMDLEEEGQLKMNFNATLMSHKQELYEVYYYKDVTETNLSGASEIILNGGLNYTVNDELPFNVTLTGNYSSDKIFALGAPTSQSERATQFNDDIIEKGFVSLDLVVTKKISEKLSVKGSFKNLLNPSIDQEQNVRSLSTGDDATKLVQSYKKGVSIGLSASYTF